MQRSSGSSTWAARHVRRSMRWKSRGGCPVVWLMNQSLAASVQVWSDIGRDGSHSRATTVRHWWKHSPATGITMLEDHPITVCQLTQDGTISVWSVGEKIMPIFIRGSFPHDGFPAAKNEPWAPMLFGHVPRKPGRLLQQTKDET